VSVSHNVTIREMKNEPAFFVYTGQDMEDIPRDVIHVEVHPSVRAIKINAFRGCLELTTVNLGTKLEEIGVNAFYECKSLREVVIPPSVKKIKKNAFF
jgi:hypothetical protein